jgi:malto-oligosyltrehalose trehalohydrolase
LPFGPDSVDISDATNEGDATNVHSMPFGVSLEAGGIARFRLFAPGADHVDVELEGGAEPMRMTTAGDGWHELRTPAASAGSRYRFVLPDGSRVPDPASRYQPEDVHGPSEVIDPRTFVWADGDWGGRPWTEAVLYELHVGTFTREGTFRAAMEKLDHLVELGITAVELMCLSDFAGNRNWGYDGVLMYAPDSAYGPPDAVKAFINAAHERGIMVILDVVYNHLGPEGNYMPEYFPQISSDRHETPWGKALNFDGEHGDVVREYIVHNALYWVEEFHVDGLRLDASHTMVDDSPKHILDELHDRVQGLASRRPIHLILENEDNIECRVARDKSGRASLYAAQWNHDITHLLGAVFSNLCEAGKADETAKLAKALAEGFVIAAQMKEEALPCSVPPTAFVSFIQTHDLVGNRVFGERIFADAAEPPIRAIASIYLLAPQIPMLFMGEEWGASTPFPFFCDYHGELAEAVRKGRCDQLDPAPSEDELKRAPNPQAESTLRSAQLDWGELDQPAHADWFHWYQRVIKVRREAVVPLLAGLSKSCASSEVLSPGAFTISWTLSGKGKLNLAANLCKEPRSGFPPACGRTIWQEGPQESEKQLGPWAVRWTVET